MGQKWKSGSGGQCAAGKAGESAAYFRAETEAEAIKANEQKSVRRPKEGVVVVKWVGWAQNCKWAGG